MTYKEAMSLLNGRARKKVGNHTYANLTDAEVVTIRFHQTDIITWYPNGHVRVNSGRWCTVTTKARINRFLPDGFRLVQEKHRWYILFQDRRCKFNDGMMICPNELFPVSFA